MIKRSCENWTKTEPVPDLVCHFENNVNNLFLSFHLALFDIGGRILGATNPNSSG